MLTTVRKMSTSGPISSTIKQKVNQTLHPTQFEIYNDSHKHAHHTAMRGAENTIESHFRLVIVSDAFQGKAHPARHRMVYKLLSEELSRDNGVHALQLETRTPSEWEKLKSED